MDIYYYIYFLFGFCIISIILFWNSNIHKSHKFYMLTQLLMGLSILFTSFAIIIQIYGLDKTQTDTIVQLYQQFFGDLVNDAITEFQQNPDLNYYYDEIFKPLHYNRNQSYKRNYIKEQQITHHILVNLASVVYFLENESNSLNDSDRAEIQGKLLNFLNMLTKSKIFIENYEHVKYNILSPSLKLYIQKNFNL